MKIVKTDVSSEQVPLRVNYLVTDREKFISDMGEKGIQVVREGQNLHEIPFINSDTAMRNAHKYGKDLLTLPSGPDQSLDNVKHVISVIKSLNTSEYI